LYDYSIVYIQIDQAKNSNPREFPKIWILWKIWKEIYNSAH